MNAPINLPDIASSASDHLQVPLAQVGMSGISFPLSIRSGDHCQTVNAKADIYVDIADPHAKGIHMSRLYRLINEQLAGQELSSETISAILHQALDSQAGISSMAQLHIRTELPLNRKALLSDNQGWKSYPLQLSYRLSEGKVTAEVQLEVTYSSTCPCSAALSRQLLARAFSEAFAGQQPDTATVADWLQQNGSVATPHSQRSKAFIRLRYSHTPDLSRLPELIINQAEDALKTPVQTAVKREDEQEFARLNGANLMFCEDASRRLHQCLSQLNCDDFVLAVQHQESLHPHDAVAKADKGIAGGYRAADFCPEYRS